MRSWTGKAYRVIGVSGDNVQVMSDNMSSGTKTIRSEDGNVYAGQSKSLTPFFMQKSLNLSYISLVSHMEPRDCLAPSAI